MAADSRSIGTACRISALNRTWARDVTQTSPVVVTPEAWLDIVGHPDSDLHLSHYGYTDHALEPVPIVDRRLDRHLLWFVVDHRFDGTVGDDRIDLESGALLWIRPGARHSFTIPQALRTYHLRIALSHGGRTCTLAPDWMLAPGAWELRGPLEELLGELQVRSSSFRTRRLKQLVGTICLLAFRRRHTPAAANVFGAAQRFRLQKLAVESVRDGVTPGDLAAELKLSPVYFSRVFRQTYGLSPRAWLVRERLRQAATLLVETDRRVGEIAHACGYRDANLFARQFRKVYRQSPREFRRG